ncbi:hypothetical protein PbB2_02826 [Candidatus Phycosocius bacilliformis]|uniref:Uncharacterized protein n=1 Tax=Candidatus Phycosocius bacilliformis TaxID=1445552 RepID=A0A2P2EDK3_9PROT|nr:hypothetical protein PbB2_02826 [Candidatus Phycosocius bacilliformis]
MLVTNSANLAETLNEIETSQGTWTNYGPNGQTTTEQVEGTIEGTGFKARFKNNPNGPDYGWGPLANTEEEATSLLLIKSAASLKIILRAAVF